MYEFSSTDEIITFCFADFSIRSNAKDLVLEKLNDFESDRSVSLLSHRSKYYVAKTQRKFVGVIMSRTVDTLLFIGLFQLITIHPHGRTLISLQGVFFLENLISVLWAQNNINFNNSSDGYLN